MIVGFGWGGWMTGDSAEQEARQRAHAAATSALVPFCLANAKTDAGGADKLGKLRALGYSYEREQFVIQAGWATMAGTEEPNRSVAEACARQLISTAEAK